MRTHDDEDVVLQHSAWQQPKRHSYANANDMRVVPPSFERSGIDGQGVPNVMRMTNEIYCLLERIQTAIRKANSLAIRFSPNNRMNNV